MDNVSAQKYLLFVCTAYTHPPSPPLPSGRINTLPLSRFISVPCNGWGQRVETGKMVDHNGWGLMKRVMVQDRTV